MSTFSVLLLFCFCILPVCLCLTFNGVSESLVNNVIKNKNETKTKQKNGKDKATTRKKGCEYINNPTKAICKTEKACGEESLCSEIMPLERDGQRKY